MGSALLVAVAAALCPGVCRALERPADLHALSAAAQAPPTLERPLRRETLPSAGGPGGGRGPVTPAGPVKSMGVLVATPRLREPLPATGTLTLRPLPDGPPVLSAEARAMESLSRLDGASLHLGTATLSGPRGLQLDGEVRLGSDGPALGGRLRVDLASRHLELPLPGLQILPRQQPGGLGLEVRAILVDRRF